METLEGIMIATTNLAANLDKAFERRFLYKIRFEKPTVDSRAKIWQTMLHGLSEKDARTLPRNSTSLWRNREHRSKHSVSAILAGTDIIDLSSIIEACRKERISNHVKSDINKCYYRN